MEKLFEEADKHKMKKYAAYAITIFIFMAIGAAVLVAVSASDDAAPAATEIIDTLRDR